MSGRTLSTDFFDRDPILVARELIGTILIRTIGGVAVGGRIVETEAYLPLNDEAAHGARGKKKRNAALYMGPGTIYVHAMHRQFCLDIVTQDRTKPGSILIRAIEPTHGAELMRANRGTNELTVLTSGPGRLCQALAITKKLDQCNVAEIGCPLRILAPLAGGAEVTVIQTPRIGLTKARDLMLRFCSAGSLFLSRKSPATTYKPI